MAGNFALLTASPEKSMRKVFAETRNSWADWRLVDWCRENDFLNVVGLGEVEVGDYRATFWVGPVTETYEKFLEENFERFLDELRRPG